MAFAFDHTEKLMGMAGLWDAWKDPPNDQWLQSCTIVVTEPTELMAKPWEGWTEAGESHLMISSNEDLLVQEILRPLTFEF